MIRTGATLLLLALAFFLVSSPWEHCEDGGRACAPVCHLFCQDGCSQAPLGEKPPALYPAAGTAAAFADFASTPGHIAFPPELPPPRR